MIFIVNYCHKVISMLKYIILILYSCDEEYLEEFNKEIILKHSFFLAVLPRNILDPVSLSMYQ